MENTDTTVPPVRQYRAPGHCDDGREEITTLGPHAALFCADGRKERQLSVPTSRRRLPASARYRDLSCRRASGRRRRPVRLPDRPQRSQEVILIISKMDWNAISMSFQKRSRAPSCQSVLLRTAAREAPRQPMSVRSSCRPSAPKPPLGYARQGRLRPSPAFGPPAVDGRIRHAWKTQSRTQRQAA